MATTQPSPDLEPLALARRSAHAPPRPGPSATPPTMPPATLAPPAADRAPIGRGWQEAVDQAAHLALPRLRLLFELVRGPANVRSLAAAIGASQNDTSYHLGEMKFRGLVLCENRGTSHIYRLDPCVRIIREGESVELCIRLPHGRLVISTEDLTTELGPRGAGPPPALYSSQATTAPSAEARIQAGRAR
jgi:DNA-binding transcriptional ArsR family regulator